MQNITQLLSIPKKPSARRNLQYTKTSYLHFIFKILRMNHMSRMSMKRNSRFNNNNTKY